MNFETNNINQTENGFKPAIIFLNGPENEEKRKLIRLLRTKFTNSACLALYRKDLLKMFSAYDETNEESFEWLVMKVAKNILNNGVVVLFDAFLPSRRMEQYVQQMKGLPSYWIGVFFKEYDNNEQGYSVYDYSIKCTDGNIHHHEKSDAEHGHLEHAHLEHDDKEHDNKEDAHAAHDHENHGDVNAKEEDSHIEHHDQEDAHNEDTNKEHHEEHSNEEASDKQHDHTEDNHQHADKKNVNQPSDEFFDIESAAQKIFEFVSNNAARCFDSFKTVEFNARKRMKTYENTSENKGEHEENDSQQREPRRFDNFRERSGDRSRPRSGDRSSDRPRYSDRAPRTYEKREGESDSPREPRTDKPFDKPFERRGGGGERRGGFGRSSDRRDSGRGFSRGGERRDFKPRSDAPRSDSSSFERRDFKPRSDFERRDFRPRSDAPSSERRDFKPRSDFERRDFKPRSDAPRSFDRAGGGERRGGFGRGSDRRDSGRGFSRAPGRGGFGRDSERRDFKPRSSTGPNTRSEDSKSYGEKTGNYKSFDRNAWRNDPKLNEKRSAFRDSVKQNENDKDKTNKE